MNLSDWFGWSVAANEEIIVVSAQEDDTSGLDGSGTVYVFDSDTGALMYTLLSPQVEDNGEFGHSVAVTPRGDVLVGAWGTSVSGVEGAGHAYLFDGKTGDLLLDIPNPAPDGFGVFGWSVAAIGNNIVVGAPATTVNGLPSSGAVYVYAGVPEPEAAAIALSAAVCWIGVYALRKNIPKNMFAISVGGGVYSPTLVAAGGLLRWEGIYARSRGSVHGKEWARNNFLHQPLALWESVG